MKNPPSNARDLGSTPDRGTKIPQAAGQLSPSPGTRGPAHLSEDPEQSKKKRKEKEKENQGDFSDLITNKMVVVVG